VEAAGEVEESRKPFAVDNGPAAWWNRLPLVVALVVHHRWTYSVQEMLELESKVCIPVGEEAQGAAVKGR
jgi:hypothetical protein